MNQEPESKNNIWLQEAKSTFLIILVAILIRTFIIEPFFIPSPSMNSTLLKGDYIFSTKYNYGFSKHSFVLLTPKFIHGRFLASQPERGDIVIFRPPHKMDTRYIKRLIGLPGDKIQIIRGITYINNQPVTREYQGLIKNEFGETYKRYLEILPNGVRFYTQYLPDEIKTKDQQQFFDNTQAYFVPEEHYFFMGDNRNDSLDSRADLGFVPFENFISKAQFIFFATDGPLWEDGASFGEQIERAWGWIKSIRWQRLLRSVYDLE